MTKQKRPYSGSRINIIGQNGNDGAHYSAKAVAYVQRQTARKLVEEVARAIDSEAKHLLLDGDAARGDYWHAQEEKLRDALALMIGD